MAEQKETDVFDKKELKSVFKALDIDGDNRIATEELKGVLKLAFKTDPDKKTIDEWREKYDTDKSGFIEFDEFVQMHEDLTKVYKAREPLWKIFRDGDLDDDDKLTQQEITELILKKKIVEETDTDVIEEKVRNYIKEADMDGDGMVNFEEFCRMCVKIS